MKQNIRLLFPALLLTAVVATAQNLDIRWLDKINGPLSPPADKSWQFVSNSTAPLGIAAPIALYAAGAATHDKDLRRKSCYAGASFLAGTALTTALKISIRRPRPFTTYPDIITKKAKGGGFSFPSGHTTAAFATATSLSLIYPKWYVIVPSYTYAGAVAYSRMYLGVHFPSDILGGILVGVGTSLLAFQVEKWLNK